VTTDYLSETGAKLVKRCGTRDPFKIAKEIGVNIMFVDNLSKLKGVYRVIKRNRWIFINSNLSPKMQRIVCAHELGHDQLHRHLAKGDGLVEFMLYDMQSRPEYEANIVASEILLPDDEVLEYIYGYQYDAEQIARAMSSDINLVALKVARLNQKGYNLNQIESKSDFLK